MTTRAPKVLLLDQDDVLRRATALLLKSQGAGVSQAATLEEAIALSQQRSYDVALIDVSPSMPEAREILERLQQEGAAPARVVLCTDAPLGSEEAGEHSVLVKPYPFEQLVALIFGRPYPRTAPEPRPSPVARARSTRRVPSRAPRQPVEQVARSRGAACLLEEDPVQTARARSAHRRPASATSPSASLASARSAGHRPTGRVVRSPQRAAQGRRHPE